MTSSWIAGGGCTALYGEVGAGATHAEVEQAGSVTRRQVEAPTGAFVVCAESDAPFVVRVFTAEGHLLDEHHEPVSDAPARLAAIPRDADGRPIGGNIRTSKTWAIEWTVDTPEQKPEP